MRAHTQRVCGQRTERFDVRFQFRIARLHAGKRLVTVHGCAAVSGHMFEAADHACMAHSVEHGAPQCGNLHRVAAEGAIADHIVGFGTTDIERRVIIDTYADQCQFAGHRLGIHPRRFDRAGGSDFEQTRKRLSRGVLRPFRRLHAHDPTAFLVDRYDQAVTAVDTAQIIRKRPHLFAIFAIAGKQDVACRIGVLEEGAFVGRQFEAGNAEDCGQHRRKNALLPAHWQATWRQEVWK